MVLFTCNVPVYILILLKFKCITKKNAVALNRNVKSI